MTEGVPDAHPRGSATPLTALVFAGGAARRMGGEKCGQPFEGRSLLARSLDLARAVAAERLLLPGARDLAAELGGALPADMRRVADWPDAPGPLGALGAGLEAAGHDWCLALPCDMPRLTPAVVAELARHAPATPAAVVVRGPAGREPFGALYHRALLPALRSCVDGGERSLQGWLDACAADGRLVEVPARAFAAVDPELSFLHNVNTPADLGSGTHPNTVARPTP